MAIAITPVTAANANFGPLGSAAWAAGMQMTGLGTNQLLYSTGATTLAQSANLTFDGTNMVIAGNILSSTTGNNIIGTRNFATALRDIDVNTLGFNVNSASEFQIRSAADTNISIQIIRGISFGSNINSPDTSVQRTGAGVIGIGLGAGGNGGTLDATLYKAAGTAGVASFGPSAVTSITVKGGIITAIS